MLDLVLAKFGDPHFMALLIASLGLFALASFTAEKRTKEISVRKVLGASFGSITYLLISEFLLIVATGDLIGLPFAYYLSHYLVNIDQISKEKYENASETLGSSNILYLCGRPTKPSCRQSICQTACT